MNKEEVHYKINQNVRDLLWKNFWRSLYYNSCECVTEKARKYMFVSSGESVSMYIISIRTDTSVKMETYEF